MKKLFALFIALFAMAIFVSCGDSGGSDDVDNTIPNDTNTPTDDVQPDNVQNEGVQPDNVQTEGEQPEGDQPEGGQPDDVVPPCKLVDTFFDEMPTDWAAYYKLTMAAEIADGNSTEQPAEAILAKGEAKIGGVVNKTFADGRMSYFSTGDLQLSDGTKIPGIWAVTMGLTKTVGVWYYVAISQTPLVTEDLVNAKAQADEAGQTGVQFSSSMPTTWLEYIFQIPSQTEQYVRRICYRGLAVIKEDQSGFDGSMFVCTDKNTEFAVGETLKFQIYNKMVDDEATILERLNEGVPENEKATSVCTCFVKEKDAVQQNKTMDCAEFDKEMNP